MAIIDASNNKTKGVADPNAEYESAITNWRKCRAICSGERSVKDFDAMIDTIFFKNLLIPFSESMTLEQYQFYKAEAELPGITSQLARTLVGGLLRKQPQLTFPDSVPEEATDWILNKFGQDESSLFAFLDKALWEEIQTSRAWILVDYPAINEDDVVDRELKPYPILFQAESIINWRVGTDSFGKNILQMLIIRGYVEDYTENEFHPNYVETVWVHDLDNDGFYRIREYRMQSNSTQVLVENGKKIPPLDINKPKFVLVNENINILMNGNRLTFIPAWPLNGTIGCQDPILMPIIDKEISLYNKMSRRNHLLYGAATYTPIISSDMTDEEFDEVVGAGLGSWIKLRQGDAATVLDTPTAALADMDRAIASSIEEIARLGVRMLSPETAQSGVALEIRNAAQTAQLGILNSRISNVLKQVIVFMINWRYGLDLIDKDVNFSLSTDFNATPVGDIWLRLATEWYQQGLIPRTVWLDILKQNDMLPPDYDDANSQQEINNDELIITPVDQTNMSYMQSLQDSTNQTTQ